MLRPRLASRLPYFLPRSPRSSSRSTATRTSTRALSRAPSPPDSDVRAHQLRPRSAPLEPSPVHRGHAPGGELTENNAAGSSSAMSARARGTHTFSYDFIVSAGIDQLRISTSPSAGRNRGTRLSRGQAACAYRALTSRSTTTEMRACTLCRLDRVVDWRNVRHRPSHAREPSPRSSATSSVSPFARHDGASTMKRVPSSRVITCSMIFSPTGPRSARPHMAVGPCLTRAHRSRRYS